MHTNIVANPPTLKPELRHSIYNKYNISGQPIEFCYNNEDEIFDTEKILQAIKNQPEFPTVHISESDEPEVRKSKKKSQLETQ